MSVHKSWIVNSSLSAIFITIICFLGDISLQRIKEPYQRAFCDNLTHGFVAFFTAQIIFGWIRVKWIITSMMIACAIDIDHFITARSFRLSEATNLSSRPFLHNSSIIVILIVLLILINLMMNRQYESFNFLLIATINAMLTHHLRDANRHGMWFHPVGKTRPISTVFYILLTILVPLPLSYFIPTMTLTYSRLNNFDIFDI